MSMNCVGTDVSENRSSQIETLKAGLECFYTILKQIGKEGVSGLAITVTLMEPDMPACTEKNCTRALKLMHVRKPISAESGGVFYVSAKTLMACCHNSSYLKQCFTLWYFIAVLSGNAV